MQGCGHTRRVLLRGRIYAYRLLRKHGYHSQGLGQTRKICCRLGKKVCLNQKTNRIENQFNKRAKQKLRPFSALKNTLKPTLFAGFVELVHQLVHVYAMVGGGLGDCFAARGKTAYATHAVSRKNSGGSSVLFERFHNRHIFVYHNFLLFPYNESLTERYAFILLGNMLAAAT